MTEEMALEKAGGKELKNIIFDKGVIPKDYEDVLRFAGLIHGAGLAPKGFDTPAKCAIGILTNLEQGRPAITGLQDLAIINGKCGTYGNAITAKITSSGLMDKDYPVETETGTPYEDDWTFTYTVKRKGRPAVTGRWTWIDSKRAGFDNPTTKDGRKDIWSPWTRFTRRMMQWKARSFVNQDEFGDILRGMTPVEDLYDIVDLEPGKNGTYASPEAKSKEEVLTDKIKPNYAAQDLKTKLDAGDKEVEGYKPINEEVQSTGGAQTRGHMDAVRSKSTGTQADVEETRKELDSYLAGGREEEPEPSPIEQGESKGVLPDGVDPIAWLLTSRGKSSPTNAALVIRVFKAEKETIESQSDAIKARLRRKYKDAMDYLADIEAKKQAIAEEELPDDDKIPGFVRSNTEGYDANGRLEFISKMRKYMAKDHDKYRAVMNDNNLGGMNDVGVSDQEVILGFMAEAFAEE